MSTMIWGNSVEEIQSLDEMELRALASEYVKADDTLSQTKLGEACSLSKGGFSEWMRSQYDGDSTQFVDAVKEYFIELAEAVGSVGDSVFIQEIKATQTLFDVFYSAHSNKRMRWINAISGVGKTVAAEQYQKQAAKGMVDVVTIVSQSSRKAVYSDILGYSEIPKNITADDLFRKILKKYRKSNKLLILDEAQFLETPTGNMINSIRQIHDNTGIGMVLMMQPWGVDVMTGPNKKYYAQVISRLGPGITINGPDEADVLALCQARGIEDTKVMAALYDLLKNKSKNHEMGELRMLDHAIFMLNEAVRKGLFDSVNMDLYRQIENELLFTAPRKQGN